METKTLVMVAVIIAATVALAIAPTTLRSAMADQPRTCFHKGTGDAVDCSTQKGDNQFSCNPSGKNQCRD